MDIITLSIAVQKALKELGVEKNKDKTIVGYADELTNVGYATGAVFESIDFIEGKVFYVTTDSGTFKTTVKKIEIGGEIIPCFGNAGRWASNLGVETSDTGESFAGIFAEGMLQVFDFNLGNKVILYEETKTIHPIDPKYLPGVCLPVVELETACTSNEGTACTGSDNTKLTEAAKQNLPIVIKNPAMFAVYSYDAANKMFLFPYLDMVLAYIQNKDGTWTAMVTS